MKEVVEMMRWGWVVLGLADCLAVGLAVDWTAAMCRALHCAHGELRPGPEVARGGEHLRTAPGASMP